MVSAVHSQSGGTIPIHHSDLRTLRPHQWLVGEVHTLFSLIKIFNYQIFLNVLQKLYCEIFELKNVYLTQVMGGLIHIAARKYGVSKRVFLMDHYTAGVIVKGEETQMSHQSLRKVKHICICFSFSFFLQYLED